MRRQLLALVTSALALAAGSCQQPDRAAQIAQDAQDAKAAKDRQAAESAAFAFVKDFAQPTPENEKAWGLTDVSVYGDPAAANPAGRVEFSPEPGGYRVVVPLWVKGKDADGETVRLRRRLSLAARQTDDAWSASDPKFLDDEPLTASRRFWTWSLWGLGAVAVFALLAAWVFWMLTQPRPQRAAAPSTPSSSGSWSIGDLFEGCASVVNWLYCLGVMGFGLLAALADPGLRLWAVCLCIALGCWLLNAVTSIRLFGVVGILSLGFPVAYLLSGIYGSTLLVVGLWVGTFFATAFVYAAVRAAGAPRRTAARLSEREMAEIMEMLRRQQGSA